MICMHAIIKVLSFTVQWQNSNKQKDPRGGGHPEVLQKLSGLVVRTTIIQICNVLSLPFTKIMITELLLII